MPQRKVLKVVATVGAAIVLLFPVKVTCGAPAATCAVPPGPDGFVRYYYEIEPFGVMLVEGIARTNLPLAYSSGTDEVKFR